jgi:hypothetical protein
VLDKYVLHAVPAVSAYGQLDDFPTDEAILGYLGKYKGIKADKIVVL